MNVYYGRCKSVYFGGTLDKPRYRRSFTVKTVAANPRQALDNIQKRVGKSVIVHNLREGKVVA